MWHSEVVTRAHPATCQCCGTPLAADHLTWRYPVPDVIAELSGAEAEQRLEVHTEAVIVAAGVGSFVRVRLPIRMDTDRSASLGVWLKIVDAETFYRVMDAGRTGGAAWQSLSFRGRLANTVEPWPEVYQAVAVAAVPEEPDRPPANDDDDLTVPRIVSSEHPLLSRLLTEPWPQEEFLRWRG